MSSKEGTSRLNKLNIIIYLKRNRESYVALCTLRFPISFCLKHSNLFFTLIMGGGDSTHNYAIVFYLHLEKCLFYGTIYVIRVEGVLS